MIDRAGGLAFVAQQAVPVVHEQDAELLNRPPAHPGAAIGDHGVVIVQDLAAERGLAGKLYAERLGNLDERNGSFPHIFHLEQRSRFGGKHAAQRSKGLDQVPGKLLHVAPGIGSEQQQLQQFVVPHPNFAVQVFQEMPAKPFPVPLPLFPDSLIAARNRGVVRAGLLRHGGRSRTEKRHDLAVAPVRRPVTHKAACPIPSASRSAPPPRRAPPRPCARTGPRATCPS